MRAYLIILEITPLEVGKTYPMLPLHCTLVHWFWLDVTPRDLTEHLRSITKNQPPLNLLIGEEATFNGETKEETSVIVNKVESSPKLKKLHFRICEELDRLKVQYSKPDYVKEGFIPHVTHQGKDKLTDGTSLKSFAIYLVGAKAPEYGNDRHIRSKIDLN